MRRLLVVDDDPEVCAVIQAYGESAGWQVRVAATGAEALAAIRTEAPDVVVLDVMLPDQSGWDVLEKIRAVSDLYVIMLTARTAESDRILGLTRGADDYLAKPFSPGELMARCQAVMRRPRGAHADGSEGAEVIAVNGLTVDPDQHRVEVDGQAVELTALEFTLLLTLARHPGRVFTRDQLVTSVWGDAYEGYERVIDVHVGHIRRKLADDPDAPRFIDTVRGVGYRFRPPTGARP